MFKIRHKYTKNIKPSMLTAIFLAIVILAICWGVQKIPAQSIDNRNLPIEPRFVAPDSSNGAYSFKDSSLNLEIEIDQSEESRQNSSLTIFKWDKNANFKIVLPTQINLSEIADEVGISELRLSNGDIENRLYLKSSNAFEWEIVLSEKPESNKLAYKIELDNLRFYYQDPDTFEAHKNEWDFNDNIPGSYAVYYSAGKHNRYKTGKAFHIYRPRAWNNDGDTVWCNLDIDTSARTLAISIPQGFLDSTGYPVIVDPTFGCTYKGGTGVGMGASNFRHLVNYNDYADADGSMQTAYICGYKNSQSAVCTTSVVAYSYSNTLSECQKISTSNKIEISKFAVSPDSAAWHSAPIFGTLEDDEDYIVSWQGKESCDYCLRICADYTGIWGYERCADYSDWGTNDDLSGYLSNGYIHSVYVEYDDGGGPTGNPYIRVGKLKRSH